MPPEDDAVDVILLLDEDEAARPLVPVVVRWADGTVTPHSKRAGEKAENFAIAVKLLEGGRAVSEVLIGTA
jgi:hypothetical protein